MRASATIGGMDVAAQRKVRNKRAEFACGGAAPPFVLQALCPNGPASGIISLWIHMT